VLMYSGSSMIRLHEVEIVPAQHCNHLRELTRSTAATLICCRSTRWMCGGHTPVAPNEQVSTMHGVACYFVVYMCTYINALLLSCMCLDIINNTPRIQSSPS
jgi:hypothetical protein